MFCSGNWTHCIFTVQGGWKSEDIINLSTMLKRVVTDFIDVTLVFDDCIFSANTCFIR